MILISLAFKRSVQASLSLFWLFFFPLLGLGKGYGVIPSLGTVPGAFLMCFFAFLWGSVWGRLPQLEANFGRHNAGLALLTSGQKEMGQVL
jgi:hypothetical protein